MRQVLRAARSHQITVTKPGRPRSRSGRRRPSEVHSPLTSSTPTTTSIAPPNRVMASRCRRSTSRARCCGRARPRRAGTAARARGSTRPRAARRGRPSPSCRLSRATALKTGPMHGAQPSPKTTPSSGAPASPAAGRQRQPPLVGSHAGQPPRKTRPITMTTTPSTRVIVVLPAEQQRRRAAPAVNPTRTKTSAEPGDEQHGADAATRHRRCSVEVDAGQARDVAEVPGHERQHAGRGERHEPGEARRPGAPAAATRRAPARSAGRPSVTRSAPPRPVDQRPQGRGVGAARGCGRPRVPGGRPRGSSARRSATSCAPQGQHDAAPWSSMIGGYGTSKCARTPGRSAASSRVLMPTNLHAVGLALRGDLGQVGRLGAARPAGGVPDVEHDDVAAQVGDVQRLARRGRARDLDRLAPRSRRQLGRRRRRRTRSSCRRRRGPGRRPSPGVQPASSSVPRRARRRPQRPRRRVSVSAHAPGHLVAGGTRSRGRLGVATSTSRSSS